MKYNFLRVLFILSVLYSNSYCYFSGRNAFRYGAHYPDGNNTFVYMTGPSGTYREMTDLSYVYNYYSQFNSTNHPYDRNALLAYANGQHMTTCPNSAGHLLWDLNHDGELDQVSSYGFGFFDNNGGRFIGDGSGSSNAFTNFWFDDNWLANYVVMAYENATQLPSGLTRYPQSAPKYQVLEGDSSDWTPYNTSSTYDTMILNALYYLSRNEVTTAFSLWQSIMSTASSAYDQNNQQYYYPSMSGSSAYQLGLLKILTELLALSRNDTSGSLTQHSVSLRSAILTRIQASSGSSVINTATMSLWTLGLGAGAYSNYEAGTMLKYAESASYFMRPYHALSAVKDSGSQPGYISYGPYVSFPVGTYAVDFFLRTHLPPNDGSQIVTIEVHNSITDEILSQVDITSGFINDQWVMMSTNFTSTDPSNKYEFRAYWHGKCNTDISYVRVRPSASQSLSTTGVSNPASSTSNDGATSTSGATATSGTVTTPETSSTGVAGSTTGDASTSETISSTSTNQGQFTTTDASVSTEGTKVVSDDHSSSSQDLGLILGLSIGIGGTIIVIIIIASIALIFVTLKKRRSLSKYPVEVPRGISTNFEGDAEVCLPAIMPIQKSDSKTSVTSTGSFSSIEDQKYFSFPVVTAPRKYSQSSDGSSSNRTNYVTTDYDNLPSFPDEAKEHSLEKLNPAWIISRDDISSDQQEIGRGTFGVVYKAEWRKTPVAIKNLKSDALTEKELENFRKEIKLMMSLRPHANVVQFYGIVKNPLGTVCEYLGNGSLLQLLKSDAVLSSDRKISIIAGIARGMFHLQEEKIVHRDLAARNVLMSSNFEPKISDFGLSRQVASDDNTTQDATGPLKWMAPESIKRRKYSFKSDVWSFGITVIEVLTRETPYKGLEGVQVALSVVNDKAKPHVPTDIPPELHTLLISCFEFEPALRPDFGKICDILSGITINSSSSNYELSKSLRKK